MSATRRTIAAGALLLPLLLGLPPRAMAAADAEVVGSAVKATYLVKFGSFVEWPPNAFPAPDSPFYLCVAGADPFGRLLEQAAAGQHINQHPIVVRRQVALARNAGCHIVFAAGGPQQSAADALATSVAAPVLTVTDQPPGAGQGIINFVVRDNHIRFEINEGAATQSGLRISSQLLTLAVGARSR